MTELDEKVRLFGAGATTETVAEAISPLYEAVTVAFPLAAAGTPET
jgi:hypothetical protein